VDQHEDVLALEERAASSTHDHHREGEETEGEEREYEETAAEAPVRSERGPLGKRALGRLACTASGRVAHRREIVLGASGAGSLPLLFECDRASI